MKRALGMVLTALAVVVFAGSSVLSEEKGKGDTHTGTVVSADASKLVMKDAGGKEHSHDLGADVKISKGGKDAKATDLKAGDRIKVITSGNKVTRIEVQERDTNK